jgi:hypothetical protein
MKRTMWLFIDKKSLGRNNGLLKLKNMEWSFDWNITKWKKNVLIHISNLLLGLNI